jgi:5'-phosphate synthase pdxT subunit
MSYWHLEDGDMRIGVLAAQGAFAEHIAILHQLEVDAMPVRLPHQLAGLDGLIIPGGESTAISQLIQDYNLTDELRSLAENGLPIFGTCAGMILLASDVLGASVQPFGVMDITVRRNAFGRQKESFETELSIPVLGAEPFPGVFIRAPVIEQAGSSVEILARLANDTSVAARQGKLLACAFHPELTDDLRFHRYFLNMVAGYGELRAGEEVFAKSDYR